MSKKAKAEMTIEEASQAVVKFAPIMHRYLLLPAAERSEAVRMLAHINIGDSERREIALEALVKLLFPEAKP